ncbi:MAG: CDP-glycerol glycerophosphotransferase family protein [Clostridia bacterium]|nr:CDP-glycerol glycerophosphotransferase family protein [Clostridia bacterium]
MAQRSFKFSVVMPVYCVEQYLEESVESILAQTIGFKQNIQLVLVNDGSPDRSGEICERYQKQYPDNVVYVRQENAGVSAARNNGLAHAAGTYVNFLDSDDKWEPDAFKKVWRFFEKYKDEVDVVSTRMVHFEASTSAHILNKKFKGGDRVEDITQPENAALVQMHVTSAFFKRSALVEAHAHFDPTVRYGEDSLFINSQILRRGTLGLMKSVTHLYRKRLSQTSAVQTQNTNPEYYGNSPRKHYFGLIEQSKERYGAVLPYIQNVLAYDIGWRFYVPPPPELCADPAFLPAYETMLRSVLKEIDDQYLIANEIHPHFERKNAMYRMKHGVDIYNDAVFDAAHGTVSLGDIDLIHLDKNPQAFRIMTLDVKKNTLYLEGLAFRWLFRCFPGQKKKLFLKVGKTRTQLELLPFKHDLERSYYGERKKCFRFCARVRLTKDSFDEKGRLRIRLLFAVGKARCSVALGYGRSLPNRRVNKKAYSVFGKYIVICGKTGILVERPRSVKRARLRYELAQWAFLLKKGKLPLLLLRLRVLLLSFCVRNQSVWLLSDRAENAGDNGEVFFKYLTTHTPLGVRPVFAISQNAQCADRLQSEGETVFLEDKKYRTLFLRADKIISSSANEFTLNPFDRDARYLRDLFPRRFYYLQHGVACADLSAWLNKYSKNIHMICAASKRERRAFLKGAYYYGKRALPVTGQARFDELTDHREKLILVLPTWRKAIRESYDENTTSVYFPGFKDTDYFKYFNRLINDERLLAAMREKGYRGLFCIHPIHMKQAPDFTQNDVFSVNPGYVDYNDVFARAAMMVTDYSSVLFDFAYLRKRVLYTQPDKDEFFAAQTYDEGYFCYERDGFGPVCYDYDATVDAMIAAVNEDCVNPPQYVERVDKFFAFHDQNNSRRILEAILKRP